MGRLRGTLRQIRALVRKRQVERELDEELSIHIAMETEKNLREGMSPAQARRAALLAFGGVERTKERVRDARWTRWIEDLLADVRYAVRFFVRAPTFTIVAVLTVGLGIGANTALFGLVHGLISRTPAGIPPSDRIVRVDNGLRLTTVSYPDFEDLRAAVPSVIDLAAYVGTGMALGPDRSPLAVQGQLVSGAYFEALGIRPAAGRVLELEDDMEGAAPVAVLGYRLWQDRLGGRAEVIGSTVSLNGHAFAVVGVAPPGFVGTDLEDPSEVWVPTATQPLTMPRSYDVMGERRNASFHMVGRLRPGIDRRTAEAALATAAGRIEAEHPQRLKPLQLDVARLRGWIRADRLWDLSQTIVIAWIVTGLVLLLACANVANLLLARATARRREIAIRASLGAGRARVARQLLTEGLVLFVAGAGVALLFAARIAPEVKSRLFFLAPLDVSPDLRVVLFTLVVALTAGVLFSLVPAFSASDPSLTPSLRDTTAGSLRRRRIQSALVVGQVALSLVLLLTAALFLRRLRDGQKVELGFEANHVLVVSMDLSTEGYGTAQTATFYRSLVESVEALPDVQAVSGPSYAPFHTGASLEDVGVSGDMGPERLRGDPPVVAMGIASDFFRTLGVPIIRGRPIEQKDVQEAASVAVVNESLARRGWAGGNPIGRRVYLTRGRDSLAFEVVGVARDIVTQDVQEANDLELYLPYNRQYQWATTSLLVRTAGDPSALAPLIRQAVRRLDPGLAVTDAEPLSASIDRRTAPSRTIVLVLLAFGALALALAALGLFGVVSFTVEGRAREIAVRRALGAGRRAVVTGFVREGAALTGFGVAIGLALSLGFGRILGSAVTGIDGIDPAVGAASVALLAAVALLACWLPARRAARVDPMETLKAD